MQHRQDRSIANRIQELVRMPRGRERTGLSLAIADYDRDDEIRIVEGCPVSMRDGIAQLTAFMNRTGRLRRAVRADSARKRKLLEELEQAGFIPALVGINLRVVTLQITVRQRGRGSVTWAGNVHHTQVVFLDEPV